MAQTRAIGKAYRNLLAWLMKAAGFEATPAEEMDFTPAEVTTPKKPSKAEYVEVLPEEFGPSLDEIKMEIAKCTKLKQLTDLYFTHKDLFDKDELMMKLLKFKKEAITKK